MLSSFGEIFKYNPNADWYLMAEDDTVVVKSNLDGLLEQLPRDTDMYMGKCVVAHKTKKYRNGVFIMGGSGILMSGGLLRKMAPHIEKCRREYANFLHGDTRVGACLELAGVLPKQICGLAKGFKFTSMSVWTAVNSPLRRDRNFRVVTMHEKDPDKLRCLNDAIVDMDRKGKHISFGLLKKYIDRYNAKLNASEEEAE